ncbi:AtzH-like domain-containing protein [Lacisediminihabitans sp.]|uniref:AtzH-like domain-containing protein n=1 Tax=Lacisediminihabitans sp. TaxID=2787631 RepID=UPI00374DC276
MTDVRVSIPSDAEEPSGLLDAFWDYERALTENDVDALDALFAPGPDTLRGDAGGLLVGHDAIAAFRRGRAAAPKRQILEVRVLPVGDDAALVVAVTAPADGGRGQQTQLWTRADGEWLIQAAQVSVPAPAIAATTWRIVGDPLVEGAASGPLSGHRVAVKDLFDVVGFPVGAGVPQYLAESPRVVTNATAVTALLAAGASVQGIARTDEFAYSLSGLNAHYGAPQNPAVVGAIPGGSSSGPATAVSNGQSSIGLGTDTGGSIRVPASYQGLWGLRTTHGSVSRDGLLGLSPTFDTVGWLTSDGATLRAAASASLAGAPRVSAESRFAVAPRLTAVAGDEVRSAFEDALAALAAADFTDDILSIELPDSDDLLEIFRTVQAAEAWHTHGAWIEAHPGALGDDVAERFAFAKSIDAETEEFARQALGLARERIDSVLGDRILLLPSASSAAPLVDAGAEELERARSSTLRLTCIAGLAGRPALSVPVLSVASPTSCAAPVGFGLVGPVHSDLSLIDVGVALALSLG